MRLITAGDLQRIAHPLRPPRTRYRLRLRFAGVVAELRAPQRELIDEFRARYAYHVTAADPDFRYFVWDTPSGYAFWCAHDAGWCWTLGPLPGYALAFLTDAVLLSAAVHARPGVRSIHAAALALDGKGAIVAGDSTAGKTTTLLACARAGMQVLSDERGLIVGDMLTPFVRRCSVRSGGRMLLLADGPDDTLAACLRAKQDVEFERCFGKGVIAAPVPLRAIFVLHERGGAAAVERIEPERALPAISRWFDMRATPIQRLADALSLLRSRPCYRLTLGTPGESARAICSALGACA